MDTKAVYKRVYQECRIRRKILEAKYAAQDEITRDVMTARADFRDKRISLLSNMNMMASLNALDSFHHRDTKAK